MPPLVALGLFLIVLSYVVEKYTDDQVPTVTFCRILPDFINRLLFFVKAPSLISYGYSKYKDKPFRILKVDGDMIVLPAKYLPEIRLLPHTKISLLDAQFNSVCGEYTKILNDSSLTADTVAKKLATALHRIVPNVLNELQHAFKVEVPECTDRWVSVNLYSMILRLINRSTSRIIVGETLCRNEEWLNTVTTYTHNLGLTIILLRPLPRVLRPLAARFLPSVRYLDRTMQRVKDEVFVPMIVARRRAEVNDPSHQKPDDFMQWMMDTADNEFDKKPENIAQGLMIVMALAVVHTTTMLITQTIYDLLIRQEYIEPLRQEILDTLKDGWINATPYCFGVQTLLDSFMRESQRFNPTGEVNIQRVTKEHLTFSDGLTIPANTHICFAAGPLSRDPSNVPYPNLDPSTFDGFRWCRDPYAKNNKLVSTTAANLHFGFGRQACPGRRFAANTSKAILSRLLIEYDMKFEEGREGNRPMNIRNGEQIMPNFYARVLIRRTGNDI
ncbi:cytochrome P450 [Aspergillus pseudoustus]|uniref:Cytochrome P450 n=1 Tax=Aspergillus pseudoustus TaxID=1810923 RepID=A0ABR4K2Z9_9EURO